MFVGIRNMNSLPCMWHYQNPVALPAEWNRIVSDTTQTVGDQYGCHCGFRKVNSLVCFELVPVRQSGELEWHSGSDDLEEGLFCWRIRKCPLRGRH